MQSMRMHQTGNIPAPNSAAPYPAQNFALMGSSLPSSSSFQSSLDDSVSWNTMQNIGCSISSSSQNMTDTSGDESDGNVTTDSLETPFANTSWDASAPAAATANSNIASTSAPSSHTSASSSMPYSLNSAQWNSHVQPMMIPAQAPQFAPQHRAASTVLQNSPVFRTTSFSSFDSLVPQQAPLMSSSEPMDTVCATNMEPPSVSSSLHNFPQTGPAGPRRKSTSELSQLCTTNLYVSSHAQATPTPSRLINTPAFTPAPFNISFGSFDLSTWLEEPVAPSPLYEPGACTGWTGLNSALDTGRTPTAGSVRMGMIKGPRHEADGATTGPRSSLSPPSLISSVDWWAHDDGAQRRFHRYMLASLPPSPTLRVDDRRTSLSASARSRFLTYCSFLCLRDPHAPQPPFLHRHMLLVKRDKLPAPLAIARSALSALAMRLPTSEVWAWRIVGSELCALVNQASELVRKYEYAQVQATPLEKQLWLQQATSWDGCWECLSLLQALWCYTVVGAFSDSMDSVSSKTTDCTAQRIWDPLLLKDAVEVIEQLMCVVATVGMQLQSDSWHCNARTPNALDLDHSDEFLWWGLCDSLRRTVLASHAMLVLWKYTRSILNGESSVSCRIDEPLIAKNIAPQVYQKLMTLELPAVAAVFEADNVTQWRHQSKGAGHNGQLKLTLATFVQHRPSSSNKQQLNEIPSSLTSYFYEHDEFTNICLSALFGLTER